VDLLCRRAASRIERLLRGNDTGLSGEWARYGFVVEGSDTFKVIPGAKLQLFWKDGKLPDSKMILIREVVSGKYIGCLEWDDGTLRPVRA
jgi:hypothetical protein